MKIAKTQVRGAWVCDEAEHSPGDPVKPLSLRIACYSSWPTLTNTGFIVTGIE